MTLITVILAAALGWFIWRRGARRAGLGLMLATLLLFFAIGTGFVPHYLLAKLQTGNAEGPKWAVKNTFVVLGAGTTSSAAGIPQDVPPFGFSRLVVVVEAYRACLAAGKRCQILVSGGDPQAHGMSEAVVYSKRLQGLGVPSSDLILETSSKNTWQNADFSCALIKHDGQVVLVSSGIHLRRARLYFEQFCGPVQGIPSDHYEARITFIPNAMNFLLSDIALHEFVGVLRFRIYNAMGWNSKP